MPILRYRTGKHRPSAAAMSIHMETMVLIFVLVGSCVVYPKDNR
jgi:hypothetical protein